MNFNEELKQRVEQINALLAAKLPGKNSRFSFAEDTDDLFVGKTLLHYDVLM